MKFKAIIIDDELQARLMLSDLCETYFNERIEIVAQCNSVDTAIIAIDELEPDVLFLDIDMPDKNGFELVNHYVYKNFEIVFITAHSDYYLEAIQCSALDYIMKPINPLNLKSIIERLENRSIQQGVNRLEVLINQLKSPKREQLVISNSSGFINISIPNIIYCQSEEGYSFIVCKDGKILSSKSLKETYDLLPKEDFIRVSNKFIVNKKEVRSFKTESYELEMSNGDTVQVSDRTFNKKSLIDVIAN